MIENRIFEDLQAKIDEEAAVRDVSPPQSRQDGAFFGGKMR